MFVTLNWHVFKYGFYGDVEIINRLILVHKDDQDFQIIVFRKTVNSQIRDYKQKTVTIDSKNL